MSGTLPPIGFAEHDASFCSVPTTLAAMCCARLIYGARVALTVAFVAATLAAVFGTLLGLLAGYYGGITDTIVSRLIEIWMAFPPVLLSILVVAIMGSGVVSVVRPSPSSTGHALPASSARRRWRRRRPITSLPRARSAFPRLTILFREILPNVAPVLLALLTLEMGIAVIVEAILSFVGLSVSSDTPTWGGMIAQGRQIIYQAWWVFAAPLVALFRPCSPSINLAMACAACSIRSCSDERAASCRFSSDRHIRSQSCAGAAACRCGLRAARCTALSVKAALASPPSPRRSSASCRTASVSLAAALRWKARICSRLNPRPCGGRSAWQSR